MYFASQAIKGEQLWHCYNRNFTELTHAEYLCDHMGIFPIPQDAVHTCVGHHSSLVAT